MIRFAPDRLLGMANLPIQDPIAARDEIFRCVEELNLSGASIGTSSIKQLDDPCYDILYEAFELLGVPLFIHPAPSGIDRPLIEESLRKYELDLMVGFSFQETIAVSNLIFGANNLRFSSNTSLKRGTDLRRSKNLKLSSTIF